MSLNNNLQAFFELVRAGLWETEPELQQLQTIDYSSVYIIAEEQSVIGLVAAGLEHAKGLTVPKDISLAFAGSVLQLEQRNTAMNRFIGGLIEKMRGADIYSLLVKGQGIAQCYARPLWRACGDVDFWLSKDNYKKAKEFLIPIADSVEEEDYNRLHLGLIIDTWVIELHGSLRTELSKRMNKVIDEVQYNVFYGGNVRSWLNGHIQVFLPAPNNDVVIIFTHFIDHFYGEGVGLRQICDWCMLIWTYRDSIDRDLLERRIRKMGLITEWKSFALFAVEYLGMPSKSMPLFSDSKKYRNKASKICELVLETGNFGHNKDNSYRKNYSKVRGLFITFLRRLEEFARLSTIFPRNAPVFFVYYVLNRFKALFV